MRTTHLGYTIFTATGLDEHDKTFTIYRIYKPEPLTALSSEDHYDDQATAMEAAKLFIEEHLGHDK